jgi:hypothetical protein
VRDDFMLRRMVDAVDHRQVGKISTSTGQRRAPKKNPEVRICPLDEKISGQRTCDTRLGGLDIMCVEAFFFLDE